MKALLVAVLLFGAQSALAKTVLKTQIVGGQLSSHWQTPHLLHGDVAVPCHWNEVTIQGHLELSLIHI